MQQHFLLDLGYSSPSLPLKITFHFTFWDMYHQQQMWFHGSLGIFDDGDSVRYNTMGTEDCYVSLIHLADDWVTITTYLTLEWGVFKKVEVAASSKSCKVLHGSATQQHQLPPHICCCLKIQIWTLFFGAELRPNTELSWAHDTRMAVSKSLLIKPALLHAQLLIQTQPSYSHQSATFELDRKGGKKFGLM